MEPIESRSDLRHKLLDSSPTEVFAAISDPDRVARWWGPDGFTNTIHQFEFKAEGTWQLTMHGPDGKDYPNENRFKRIVTNRIVEIEHIKGSHFILTLELLPAGAGTEVKWRQTFDTVEQYQRLEAFVGSANEQNLERFAVEVRRRKSDA